MEIVPFPGKIFIKPKEANYGGLESSDNRKIEEGTVAAIGEGVDFVKVGDYLYFDSWGMSPREIDGQMYFIGDKDRKNFLCKIVTD